MARRHSMVLTSVLGVALLVAGGAATAAGEPSSRASDDFIKAAASGGMMEVELGRMAMTRAANPRVKEFGQRMVEDHTRASGELKQVAQEESVKLPDTMSAEHRATVSQLSNLQGEAFDRAYMQAMVKDHTEDVQKFKTQASSADEPAVKQFAAKTLPVLQSHLKMAQDINAQTSRTTAGTR